MYILFVFFYILPNILALMAVGIFAIRIILKK